MDAQKLKNLAVSANGFIFDPATGHSYTANETGVFLLQKISDGHSVEELIREVTDAYAVDRNTAEQDVVMMIEHLKSHFLV